MVALNLRKDYLGNPCRMNNARNDVMQTARLSNYQFGLAIFLLLMVGFTRASHVGSTAVLPDATLAAMLLGGITLRRGVWFAALMGICIAVDAFAIGVEGVSNYCLSPAYWALLPTYAVMWLGGRWLAKRSNAFEAMHYAVVALATTTVAFLISTYSFYLFSGRFPQVPLWEVMQHGWEYFPAYLGYTMMYLGLAWGLQRVYVLAISARNSQHA
jgi:hypothetical protein